MRTINEILASARTVAVIGLSADPTRHSHIVAKYLQQHGYRIIPVNPAVDYVLGEKSYPDLRSVPVNVDVVNIFRRPEHVPPIVDQSLEKGVNAIWMQLDIMHEEAAATARSYGVDVIMNRCMLVEHQQLSS